MRSSSLRDLLSRCRCIALALLLPWLAVGQDPPQAGGRKRLPFSGTVTDQTRRSRYRSNRCLNKRSRIQQETQTDDKGAYSFTGLDAGTYTLSITCTQFCAEELWTTLRYRRAWS